MYCDTIEKEQKSRSNFTKSRGTGIDGKWKHDRYQTVRRVSPKKQFKTTRERPVTVVPRSITTSSIRGRQATTVVTIKEGPSTLFISNLASTVTQEDLEELFEQYTPEVVSLHYDSNGTSLGTADLVIPSGKVALVQKDLEGVLLDGQQIEVLETNVAKQVSVFDRLKKVGRAAPSFKTVSQRVVLRPKGGRVVRKGRKF